MANGMEMMLMRAPREGGGSGNVEDADKSAHSEESSDTITPELTARVSSSNPYTVFDITKSTSPDEIRNKKKKLLKIYYPKTGESDDLSRISQNINDAYNKLVSKSGELLNPDFEVEKAVTKEDIVKDPGSFVSEKLKTYTKENIQETLNEAKTLGVDDVSLELIKDAIIIKFTKAVKNRFNRDGLDSSTIASIQKDVSAIKEGGLETSNFFSSIEQSVIEGAADAITKHFLYSLRQQIQYVRQFETKLDTLKNIVDKNKVIDFWKNNNLPNLDQKRIVEDLGHYFINENRSSAGTVEDIPYVVRVLNTLGVDKEQTTALIEKVCKANFSWLVKHDGAMGVIEFKRKLEVLKGVTDSEKIVKALKSKIQKYDRDGSVDE